MPLDTQALKDGLEAVFADPSMDPATLAGQWADAFQVYAAGVNPPSSTVGTAAATFAANLTPIFATPGTLAEKGALLDTAIFNLAAGIGAGMAPAFTFVVFPPASVGCVAAMAPPWPETHAQAAEKWGTLFDTYFRLSTATQTVTPFATIPWT